MKKYIFVRDDDVYKYNKKFINVFNFLKRYRIPVIYGVIPKLIEKALVEFLNKEKNENPKLLDIVQHGWAHKNYSKNSKNKYEFGASRTYLQQKHDIQKGYLKMKKLFNKNFTPAFVPPYHGYNLITLKIISELKIPIFSAGEKLKQKNNQFINMPARFSLNGYRENGVPFVLEINTLIKRFLSLLRENELLIGIVFHHTAIRNKKAMSNFKKFFFFLKKLEREELIKFTLFSNILEKSDLPCKNNFINFLRIF
jgi:peptidoglycan/xylan/chitin deacetylase (PgdA/CDA1 family)